MPEQILSEEEIFGNQGLKINTIEIRAKQMKTPTEPRRRHLTLQKHPHFFLTSVKKIINYGNMKFISTLPAMEACQNINSRYNDTVFIFNNFFT